jgi:serine phosphatase RsbU (regulator of sigma subunit)
MIMKKLIFLLIVLALPILIYPQNSTIDSLIKSLPDMNEDSLKVDAYNEIGWEIKQSDPDRAIDYFNKALALAEKINFKRGIGRAYNRTGYTLSQSGRYADAVENLLKARKVYEEIVYLRGVASVYSNLGYIYGETYNPALQLDYTLKSLDIYKKLYVENPDNANTQEDLVASFIDVSKYYGDVQKPDSVYIYDDSALFYSKKINNKNLQVYLQSIAYNNNGVAAYQTRDFNIAIENFKKSLELLTQSDVKGQMASVSNNIGGAYLEMDNIQKAIQYSLLGLKWAKEVNSKEALGETYINLAKEYYRLKDYQKAYDYLWQFRIVNDSLSNENITKQINEMEARFENEKKQHEIELQKVELERKEVVIKQQTTQKFAFIGGFILTLAFAFALYTGYRNKKKANILLSRQNEEILNQKEKIAHQKDEIEKQHAVVVIQRDLLGQQKRELTDSIQYAKRIQTAILPPEEYINKSLPDHFIMFKPKDIVSGDFYWVYEQDHSLIVAAVDCTGHGVPGAFMSMLGITLLNDIISKGKSLTAAGILVELKKSVISALHQTGKEGESRDGMDCALCRIDLISNELEFAGANNPLYIIRDNQLQEIKGDKMPIGLYGDYDQSFNSRFIQLKKEDRIYVFSDGFADQFGGKEGKKFKYLPFKELLVNTLSDSMEQQKVKLNEVFESWKGELEQVDDVVVIGIKIS